MPGYGFIVFIKSVDPDQLASSKDDMSLVVRKHIFKGLGTMAHDQPAHPGRLISAFIIGFSESIISKFATG